ncbi:MAG TPA: hypothetical protein VGU25_18175 [Acidobacteriaceae bacterium]|nr:hypothetical protein [Acidobacteriaceae bacterium]
MRYGLPLFLLLSASALSAQQLTLPIDSFSSSEPSVRAAADLPDDPSAVLRQSSQIDAAQSSPDPASVSEKPHTPPPQPKRILGIMPNYRAVSAGVKPPPATPGQAFKIATKQSFDYSAFVFVGLTSAIAEWDDSHPKLGKGVPGFWAYSWRGFVDKTDGNYWVVWILPTAFHEDERYYAMGRGPVLKRLGYAVTRVVVTPDYNGHNTINGAELLGRGIAQGIGISYYPPSDRSASALATKYGYALLRDASTNAFREVWPDIAAHVFKHHDQQ